ncbi:MAG: hypothetical protein AAFY58_01660 [Planctomycetota bacterium]
MDERQAQIKEGAGLEESRVNTDLVEFLRKWSTPLLLVLVAIVGAYVLKQRVDDARQRNVDSAFAEHAAAMSGLGEVSPDSLRAIAENYDSVPAVRDMARLDAGDAYLRAAISGVKPGAVVDLEGAVENEKDLIAADERDWWYGQAQEMYQAVWDATGEESGRPMTSIGAAFGLGSIAESRGDLDAAGEWYATAGRVAESAKLPNFVSLAEQRSSEMVAVADRPVLISSVNLPTPPENELDRIRREFNRQSMPDLDMEPLEIPDVFGELGGDADDAGDEPVPAGPALPEAPSETPDER